MDSADTKAPVTTSNNNSDDGDGLDWGAEAIGKRIKRKPAQVYYLYRSGALEGYVFKIGHRTLVGRTKKLLKFPG
jgi:hypothetical protein